ncbi:Acylpyruvase fahd1, mitochondrial [Serendipita sp. 398]|nr:Acylpyruvase fahd1, mitochondrial [Serendipita sp. 398]
MASSFAQTGRKIVAIGRNYAKHAKELGNAVPDKPFFFLKPTSSFVLSGGNVEIPKGVIVHHEVELGVVIGKRGRDISATNADEYVAGYALGIDMTARNVQDAAKKKALPWTTAKGFDTFTPISDFIPKSSIADPSNLQLWLKINGVFKQNGTTNDMIFGVPQLIEHVSSIMTLEVRYKVLCSEEYLTQDPNRKGT